MRLILPLLLLGLPAAAQEIDCANAMAQQELNICAEMDWQEADARLNRAYKAAMALLDSWEGDLSDEYKGGPEALRKGQRAWITYRDEACKAEGFAMRGGSAEPLLVYGCMARLTQTRAQDLEVFAEGY